jgi:dihydroorotate dehydrogenase electron transfer subunit
MAAPPIDARSFSSTVREVRDCGEDGVILRVAPGIGLDPLRAARFFMLRRPDGLSPGIPRPFSLYRQLANGDLEFLIKVMGPGTRALAATRPGESLLTVGPLGNGWPVMDAGPDPWVLVAGGIGSAPFLMGIEQALAGTWGPAPAAEDITLIYGAQRAALLYDLEAFEALGVRVLPATDDGSAGFAGNVVQALEQEQRDGRLPQKLRIMTCGPDPMMAAVARLAAAGGSRCWVSLETMMGCGVGICNGCAVPTRPGSELGEWPYAKCCVDGPVFAADSIDF